MTHQATHYFEPDETRAACGRGLLTVARNDEPTKVTCKQCLHKLNAPVFAGRYNLNNGTWVPKESV